MKSLAASGVLLSALASTALAQKTDVVQMANGDRFTGEIKEYAGGRLSLDTPDAGVISIKWNRILSLTSDKVFDIELVDGTHLFGALAPSSPPGKIAVVSERTSRTIDYFDVARMNTLYQSFWRRISGSFDLGFNYTQANEFAQLNLNGDATYRVKSFEIQSTLSVFASRQRGVVSSQRASLVMDYAYFLERRWFLAGFLGADRNQDLGLDLRVSAGAGAGRFLFRTNRSSLAAIAGISGNRETPTEGEPRYNAEAFIGVDYSTFMYDFPKLTFDASMKLLPSLTEGGRVRVQANVSVRREIVSDFYIALSVFDSYDSRPPTEGAARNDWGPVISLGYKF